MKYYSEILDKMFDNKSDLINAEHEHEEKNKKDSKSQLEITYNEYLKAKEKADKILKEADEEVKPLYHQICDIYDKANDEMDKVISEAEERYEEEKRKYVESSGYNNEIEELLKLFWWL